MSFDVSEESVFGILPLLHVFMTCHRLSIEIFSLMSMIHAWVTNIKTLMESKNKEDFEMYVIGLLLIS